MCASPAASSTGHLGLAVEALVGGGLNELAAVLRGGDLLRGQLLRGDLLCLCLLKLIGDGRHILRWKLLLLPRKVALAEDCRAICLLHAVQIRALRDLRETLLALTVTARVLLREGVGVLVVLVACGLLAPLVVCVGVTQLVAHGLLGVERTGKHAPAQPVAGVAVRGELIARELTLHELVVVGGLIAELAVQLVVSGR